MEAEVVAVTVVEVVDMEVVTVVEVVVTEPVVTLVVSVEVVEAMVTCMVRIPVDTVRVIVDGEVIGLDQQVAVGVIGIRGIGLITTWTMIITHHKLGFTIIN
jgi:hypothetical protein